MKTSGFKLEIGAGGLVILAILISNNVPTVKALKLIISTIACLPISLAAISLHFNILDVSGCKYPAF